MTDGREPCSIAGCRRTVKRSDHPAHYDRFVCSGHWRLVCSATKRVKARHEREHRRFGFYPRPEAYERICGRVWREAGA